MPVVTAPDIGVGPCRHVQPYLYWSCEGGTVQDPCRTDGPATGFEWSVSFGNGLLGTDILANDWYVTAYSLNTTPCAGDCAGNSQVTVDDILTMVTIALGKADFSACMAGDADNDWKITVAEILAAVNSTLKGCS